jgi:hypothetical protein
VRTSRTSDADRVHVLLLARINSLTTTRSDVVCAAELTTRNPDRLAQFDECIHRMRQYRFCSPSIVRDFERTLLDLFGCDDVGGVV